MSNVGYGAPVFARGRDDVCGHEIVESVGAELAAWVVVDVFGGVEEEPAGVGVTV